MRDSPYEIRDSYIFKHVKLIRIIYTAYSILLFWALLLVLGPFIMIPLSLSQKAGAITFFFIRVWAKTWSFLCGIRFEIQGREYIQKGKSYIFIFNHRSFLDAPVVPMAIPHEVRALGKKELSHIPVFGWVLRKVAVWVDRTDTASRRKSIARLSEFLHCGISIVVAPEGTRNDTAQLLLPFEKGAFRLAVETGIPIITMAVIGADKLMPRGSLLMRPGKIRVYFSQAIAPPPPSDDAAGRFSEECSARLEAMLLTHQ